MKTFTTLKFALVYCCLFLSSFCFAHSDPEANWNAGKVELQNGEWLSGDLNFNAELGLLEFNLDGVTTVLSAQKVASFYFFDYQANRMRNFVVESFKHKDQLVPTFFEVMVDGKIRLLGQEQVFRVPLQEEKHKRNVYYFQHPNGEIVKYNGRLRQIYKTLNDRHEDIAFFVNRVKWYQFEEKPVVELFRYCNSL